MCSAQFGIAISDVKTAGGTFREHGNIEIHSVKRVEPGSLILLATLLGLIYSEYPLPGFVPSTLREASRRVVMTEPKRNVLSPTQNTCQRHHRVLPRRLRPVQVRKRSTEPTARGRPEEQEGRVGIRRSSSA